MAEKNQKFHLVLTMTRRRLQGENKEGLTRNL
jgi:hypothetical protein